MIMMRRMLWSGSIMLLALGVVGCGAPVSKAASPAPTTGISTPTTTYYADTKTSGAPISLTSIPDLQFYSNLGMPPGTKLYSLRYWSQGVRVQGYVAMPPSRTPLPILVNLHGGYMLSPGHHTNHYPSITPAIVAGWVMPGFVTFLPNYAGWGLSGGYVGDGYSSYVDTVNGLTALHKVFGSKVQTNTDLWGVSMGGFVAMKLAATDPNIKAMVLKSPFPGAAAFMSWAESRLTPNSMDSTDLGDFLAIQSQEGANPQSRWYVHNSIVYRDITVPTLIIGGESDPIFPPSLLRQLKSALSTHDAHVTLTLMPGGHAPKNATAFGVITEFLKSHH